MLAGEPPFDGVDTLLFTHDHPDHFSPERLMQYLRYRTVRQVVLPVMEPQHWEILQPFLEERRIQWTLLTARMQTADFQIPGGTVIRPYFTRHIDKAFWTVPHAPGFWMILSMRGLLHFLPVRGECNRSCLVLRCRLPAP